MDKNWFVLKATQRRIEDRIVDILGRHQSQLELPNFYERTFKMISKDQNPMVQKMLETYRRHRRDYAPQRAVIFLDNGEVAHLQIEEVSQETQAGNPYPNVELAGRILPENRAATGEVLKIVLNKLYGLKAFQLPASPFEYKKVIFNDPATIVLWADGTKTVVKCDERESFDPEKGLSMCFMKKAAGEAFHNILANEAQGVAKKYLDCKEGGRGTYACAGKVHAEKGNTEVLNKKCKDCPYRLPEAETPTSSESESTVRSWSEKGRFLDCLKTRPTKVKESLECPGKWVGVSSTESEVPHRLMLRKLCDGCPYLIKKEDQVDENS